LPLDGCQKTALFGLIANPVEQERRCGPKIDDSQDLTESHLFGRLWIRRRRLSRHIWADCVTGTLGTGPNDSRWPDLEGDPWCQT